MRSWNDLPLIKPLPLVALAFLSLAGHSCGYSRDHASGFLTDEDVCAMASEEQALPHIKDEALYYMNGGMVNQPELAQEFTISKAVTGEDRAYLWGTELLLKKGSGITLTDPKENWGVVAISDSVGGVPKMSENVVEAGVSEGSIDTSLSWVRVVFPEPIGLDTDKSYWLTFTPSYSAIVLNRVGWGTMTGTGLMRYEAETAQWKKSNAEGILNLLSCGKKE